jgi:putative aldouronate transport system substrate-binding protein
MTTNRNVATLGRRSFLAAGGGLALASALAACGGGSGDGGAFDGKLTAILPGNVPTGWDPVLAAVNTKLEKDLGFTLATQFISFANFADQSLLKFTAGAKFDCSLQARWLNMTQLVQDSSLTDLTGEIAKQPNLSATIDATVLEANQWNGHLWGVPQVNSAARLAHMAIRQDLAEKYGFAEIADYDTLERFWYKLKQSEPDMIPFTLSTGSVDQTATMITAPLFNAAAWDDPHRVPQSFTGDSLYFYLADDAATTGTSNPVPFWERDDVIDALRRTRQYYQDDIINHDALNLDSTSEHALFTSGKSAGTWAMTDGTSSSLLPALQKAVPGAAMANVVPLRDGKAAKPNQLFQSDNFVVLNGRSENTAATLQLQDWLSIKENHDLISYGQEGEDWKAVGDDQYESLSQYAFPGFALCWRAPLERLASYTTESEKDWFEWSQDASNFTTDTFAGFIPDVTDVATQNTQVTAAVTQYGKPLFAGAVDVDKGLSDLKTACDRAGLDALQQAMSDQADAYLASRKG